MGKKPVIGLAGLFLAGVAITATGCGQCTTCNTRPDKLRPGPMAKAPTPAGGVERKPLGEMAERPAPTPPADIMTTSATSMPPAPVPPPGPVDALKRPTTMPPAPAMTEMPGRDPIETMTPSMSRSATPLPVPPTPVRSTLPSDGIPARPMSKTTELPHNTTSVPPAISTTMPSSAPPPPVSSTPPAPQPLSGGGSLPGDALPPLPGSL